MHPEALGWFEQFADTGSLVALDIGGRDVNGTPRPLFPNTAWTVLDIAPGPGVNVVADAAHWDPDKAYDLVIASEVFEHAKDWRGIVETVYEALKTGGRFITTMAGPGRPVHSGVDGGPDLYPGEYYGNVDPAELMDALKAAGFVDITVDRQDNPSDVRAVATK